MNHYIKNLETGKLELHFEKADYQALSAEQKSSVKSAFLWSRFANAWVSRSTENHWRAEAVAKNLSLTFQGETGVKLSFEEKENLKMEKASNRSERFTDRAEKASAESMTRYKNAKQLGDMIPMGQPILIGHHSERGHRRHIEKIDNNMRKSIEADNKAEYYTDRAATAERTASGEKYNSPTYLSNRIKECETKLRELNRLLFGIGYINRETGERYTKENPLKISEARRNQLDARVTEETEKLNFYKEKQSLLGEVYTKELLKEKRVTHVKRRGTWFPIKSLNAKSVTILNWIVANSTWKCTYEEIQGIKTIEDMYVVYDRDQKEVKPTIKIS